MTLSNEISKNVKKNPRQKHTKKKIHHQKYMRDNKPKYDCTRMDDKLLVECQNEKKISMDKETQEGHYKYVMPNKIGKKKRSGCCNIM